MTFDQLIQSTVDYNNAPTPSLMYNVPANLRFTAEVAPGVDIFDEEIVGMDPSMYSRKVIYARPELQITFTVTACYGNVWYPDNSIRTVKTYMVDMEESRDYNMVFRTHKTVYSEEGVYEAITQTLLWK